MGELIEDIGGPEESCKDFEYEELWWIQAWGLRLKCLGEGLWDLELNPQSQDGQEDLVETMGAECTGCELQDSLSIPELENSSGPCESCGMFQPCG